MNDVAMIVLGVLVSIATLLGGFFSLYKFIDSKFSDIFDKLNEYSKDSAERAASLREYVDHEIGGVYSWADARFLPREVFAQKCQSEDRFAQVLETMKECHKKND